MNNNELVILAFEKARQNVQKNKPNVLVTLNMITRHFAKEGSDINTHRVRNFMRHFETYIVKGKKSKLYQDYTVFYSKYLEVNNQKEFENKYATELQNLTQITESLKKLNQKESVTVITDNLEKQEKSEYFPKKNQSLIKNYLRKEYIAGIVTFAVLILVMMWYRKTQPLIHIENFNVGTQYYYATDRKGNYVIGTFDQLQNPKPLTPQVFDAYFQQQGLDSVQPEVRFIKANYFSQDNLITDVVVTLPKENVSHQADPKPSTPKTPDPKPHSPSKNSTSIVFVEFVNPVGIENELLLKFNQSFENYTFTTKENVQNQLKCILANEIQYCKSQILNDVVVCRLKIVYTFSKTENNLSFKGGDITSNGAGFTESEALQNALTKLNIQPL